MGGGGGSDLFDKSFRSQRRHQTTTRSRRFGEKANQPHDEAEVPLDDGRRGSVGVVVGRSGDGGRQQRGIGGVGLGVVAAALWLPR